jgi:hypothetical protein
MEIDKETARILSCDMSIRPPDAAGISELVPYVRRVQRELETVTIFFDASVGEALNSFVEAERLCCGGLNWLLQRDEKLIQLRIAGNEEQLATIESWLDVK